jgi:hypothetical protein
MQSASEFLPARAANLETSELCSTCHTLYTTLPHDVHCGARARGQRIEVALLYQPIGFRWAQNLGAYRAAREPARFVRYYESMAGGSATTLASASLALAAPR